MEQLHSQDAAEEEIEEEYYFIQEYRDKWNDVESGMHSTSAQRESGGSIVSESSAGRNEKSLYKLPKLKLVEFNGIP